MIPDTSLDQLRAAIKNYEARQLQDMTVPPLDVLSRPTTKADVAAYPTYFIVGPGREIAENTACEHGYMLTSSCPGCDASDPYPSAEELAGMSMRDQQAWEARAQRDEMVAGLEEALVAAEEELGILKAQARDAYQQWRTVDMQMGEKADEVIALRRKLNTERNHPERPTLRERK